MRSFVLGIYCIAFCLRRVFRLAFPCAALFVSSERAHVPRDASDLRLEGDTHHAKFFFLSSLVGSGECPVWGDVSCWLLKFWFHPTESGGNFLSDDDDDDDGHPIFELLAPARLPLQGFPRLLNKLNVSPRDTQTSVCVT